MAQLYRFRQKKKQQQIKNNDKIEVLGNNLFYFNEFNFKKNK